MEYFNMFRTRAVQGAAAIVLTFLFAVSASAYTIVMRGGRRIEIPSQFVLTKTTLTYEVSPGIQVSLATAAIDMAETEKANSEKPGSLVTRMQTGSGAPAMQRAARTITNRDLEASARRRHESEAAYEIRRKELGLPTLEESRRRTAVVPDLAPEVEQNIAADRQSEGYWRARASALRTEIAAVDAEIRYVRQRLDETPSNTLSSSTVITGFGGFGGFGGPVISFGNGGGRHTFGGRHTRRPNIFVAPRTGPQLSGRNGFGGGASRGHVFLNPRGHFGRRPFGGVPAVGFPSVGFPSVGFPGPVFGAAYGTFGQSDDFSYERSELINSFNQLSSTRAGLNARWRELEEEARRAGAAPGWLRR